MTISHGKMALPKIKTKKNNGTPMVLGEGVEYIVTFSRASRSGRLMLALSYIDEITHHRHLVDLKRSNAALKLDASDVREGLIVIVFDAKSDSYFRGQLISKPDKDNKVLVLSLDTGHIIRRSPDSMFYISREYLSEPFESFECHLDGLEFFESTDTFRRALAANKTLFAGELVATLVRYGKDSLPIVKLVSGNGKTNLNTKLVADVYSRSPGSFPTKEESMKKVVSISHHDTTPFIFIQFGEGSLVYDMEYFTQLMTLEELLTKAKPFKIEELTLTDIYLAPYEDTLYRAKCVQTDNVGTSKEPMIEVLFIDYGNKSTVPLGHIRRAGLIDPHLERIPPLCHRVNLKWVTSITDTDRFDEAIQEKFFHLDHRKPLPDGTQVVSLHLIEDGGKDINMNKQLVMDRICKGPKGK